IDNGERPHDGQRLIVTAKATQQIGVVERRMAILRIALILCAKPTGHCGKLRVVHMVESGDRCRTTNRACRRPINGCATGKYKCRKNAGETETCCDSVFSNDVQHPAPPAKACRASSMI